MSGLVLVTAPAEEPITATEGKLHLRVDFADDDALITALIKAARLKCEEISRRAYVTQTWDLYLDAIPETARIDLPLPPLQSVTGVYYTLDGASESTLAASNYIVDARGEPGGVVLTSTGDWPTGTLTPVNGIRVRFVTGYGAASAVPELHKAALKLTLAHLYENREAVMVGQGISAAELPMGVRYLLEGDRFYRFQ